MKKGRLAHSSTLYYVVHWHWNLDTSLAVLGALVYRLHHLTARLMQDGGQGLKIGQTLGYWGLQSSFAKKVHWFNHSFDENLKNPKWLPGGPKMANWVWEEVYPSVFGPSRQLSLNKFYDSSTPSMRKLDNGKGEWKKKDINDVYSCH